MENIITLVSGEIIYPDMNTSLDEAKYAKFKVYLWLEMLNDNQKPRKWNKATKKGTKVHFDYIRTQDEYNQGIVELKVYISEVNETFSLDIELRGSE